MAYLGYESRHAAQRWLAATPHGPTAMLANSCLTIVTNGSSIKSNSIQ